MTAPTSDQLNSMAASLQTLNSAYMQAVADVGGASTTIGSWVLNDVSSQEAAQTSLAQSNLAIGQLSSSLYQQVLAGTYTYDAWYAYAQQVLSGIQYVDKDTQNWQLSGVVSQTASATATTVTNAAVTGLAITTPILLLVGGLYLFLLFGLRR